MGLPGHWNWQFTVVLGLSLLAAFGTVLAGNRFQRVVLLGARAAFVIFVGIPLQNRALVQLPLTMSIAFDAGSLLPVAVAVLVGPMAVLVISGVQGATLAWNYSIEATGSLGVTLLRFVSISTFAIACAFRMSINHYAGRANHLAKTARSATELSRVNLELQQHTVDVEREAIRSERKRVTREIHDSVGYILMNQITLMEVAIRLTKVLRVDCDKDTLGYHNELVDVLGQSHCQAKDGLNEVREILHKLRETETNADVTGIDRIRTLVSAFKNTPIFLQLKLSNIGNESFSTEIDYILFRTVQEGITNALRHGNATKIEILLLQNDDIVAVTILDNGDGADVIEEGIGLSGIRERIERIDGDVRMQNSVRGFQLHVRLPWKRKG